MNKVLMICALISSSLYGWQLPTAVKDDLVRADELTLAYHAYDRLDRLVQHSVMVTTCQPITLEQFAAALTDDELALIHQVCTRVAGSVTQAYEEIKKTFTALQDLQKRYKKADRSRFRPRLDARLSTLVYVPQLARLLRAALRQHAVYFFAQERVAAARSLYQKEHTLPHEAFNAVAYEYAYVSLLHEYCEQRYRFFSVELDHVRSRLKVVLDALAPDEFDAEYERPARDAEEALLAAIAALHKQTINDEQETLTRLHELKGATKRLQHIHFGFAAGAALVGGLASFGFFCGVEALKAAYNAGILSPSRIFSL